MSVGWACSERHSSIAVRRGPLTLTITRNQIGVAAPHEGASLSAGILDYSNSRFRFRSHVWLGRETGNGENTKVYSHFIHTVNKLMRKRERMRERKNETTRQRPLTRGSCTQRRSSRRTCGPRCRPPPRWRAPLRRTCGELPGCRSRPCWPRGGTRAPRAEPPSSPR